MQLSIFVQPVEVDTWLSALKVQVEIFKGVPQCLSGVLLKVAPLK
jgi:hypothetical protein